VGKADGNDQFDRGRLGHGKEIEASEEQENSAGEAADEAR
jgi:hypothetical protein